MGQCNMGPLLNIRKYGSKQYGTKWDHFWKNNRIGAIWKYGFKNMGPFFKFVKNMCLCNMGSFLKMRNYGSMQYGSIFENTKIWVETIWDHFSKNSSIGALWKYQEYGSIFLNRKKYGFMQYGFIFENTKIWVEAIWVHFLKLDPYRPIKIWPKKLPMGTKKI